MKKLISIGLVLITLFVLCSCNKQDESEKTNNTSQATPQVFTFRDISFNSTKDEIIAAEEARNSEIVQLPINVRIDNVDFPNVRVWHLLYVFNENNPNQLVEARYSFSTNTAADIMQDKTQAIKCFEKVNAYYEQKYNSPIFTEEELERPAFNTLEKNTSSVIMQEKYQRGTIHKFSEWLFDSDGYYVDIVVFLKTYTEYDFYEVKAIYSKVEYSTVREYTNTLSPEQQRVLDDNI